MDWGIVARAVHVLAIVVWIGGVWLVTTVLLPAMRQRPPEQWIAEFDAIERRFAPQVRIALLVALLSGLYMLSEYDFWDRFAHPEFWWMHLMVGVWALFTLMLFVIEPLVSRRVLHRPIAAPAATLLLMLWLHRVMLVLALVAIFAAVGGAHGLF